MFFMAATLSANIAMCKQQTNSDDHTKVYMDNDPYNDFISYSVMPFRAGNESFRPEIIKKKNFSEAALVIHWSITYYDNNWRGYNRAGLITGQQLKMVQTRRNVYGCNFGPLTFCNYDEEYAIGVSIESANNYINMPLNIKVFSNGFNSSIVKVPSETIRNLLDASGLKKDEHLTNFRKESDELNLKDFVLPRDDRVLDNSFAGSMLKKSMIIHYGSYSDKVREEKLDQNNKKKWHGISNGEEINILLSSKYNSNDGSEKYVYFIERRKADHGCHACRASLDSLTYRKINGKWEEEGFNNIGNDLGIWGRVGDKAIFKNSDGVVLLIFYIASLWPESFSIDVFTYAIVDNAWKPAVSFSALFDNSSYCYEEVRESCSKMTSEVVITKGYSDTRPSIKFACSGISYKNDKKQSVGEYQYVFDGTGYKKTILKEGDCFGISDKADYNGPGVDLVIKDANNK